MLVERINAQTGERELIEVPDEPIEADPPSPEPENG